MPPTTAPKTTLNMLRSCALMDHLTPYFEIQKDAFSFQAGVCRPTNLRRAAAKRAFRSRFPLKSKFNFPKRAFRSRLPPKVTRQNLQKSVSTVKREISSEQTYQTACQAVLHSWPLKSITVTATFTYTRHPKLTIPSALIPPRCTKYCACHEK